MRVYFVSLGCPKNLTDSEVVMGKLVSSGHNIITDPSQAEMIVVNTCGFLQSARDEAATVIKEMARWKKKGKCQKLYIAGCLPKIDGWEKLVGNYVDGHIDSLGLFNCQAPRIKATPPWFAYVKISEGCNHNCSYCLIPKIRGKLQNREVEDILKEVQGLAIRGVKEIIFIAQDTTAYPSLPSLLRRTAKIKGIRWIRIMYAHPSHLTDDFIKSMAAEKKVVKYLDLPIQHASDHILKQMFRPYRQVDLKILIAKLRKRIPGIALRSSVIVGFPGEKEKDFQALVDFIKWAKFDKLGVFTYFREKGTKAATLSGQIPEKLKVQRFKKLMRIQARISSQKNRTLAGKKLEIIIEGKDKKVYFGRSYRDAPEIDGQVLLNSPKPLMPGDMVKVKITRSKTYDLVGKKI